MENIDTRVKIVPNRRAIEHSNRSISRSKVPTHNVKLEFIVFLSMTSSLSLNDSIPCKHNYRFK